MTTYIKIDESFAQIISYSIYTTTDQEEATRFTDETNALIALSRYQLPDKFSKVEIVEQQFITTKSLTKEELLEVVKQNKIQEIKKQIEQLNEQLNQLKAS